MNQDLSDDIFKDDANQNTWLPALPDVPGEWRVGRVWKRLIIHNLAFAICSTGVGTIPLFLGDGPSFGLALYLASSCGMAGAFPLYKLKNNPKLFEATELFLLLLQWSIMTFIIPMRPRTVGGVTISWVALTLEPVVFHMRFKFFLIYILGSLVMYGLSKIVSGMYFSETFPWFEISTMLGCAVLLTVAGYLQNIIVMEFWRTKIKLQQEQAASKALLSMFCDASCVIGSDGNVIEWCDQRMCCMLGLQDLQGNRLSEYLPGREDDLERLKSVFFGASISEEPTPVSVLPATLSSGRLTVDVDLYIVAHNRAHSRGAQTLGKLSFLIGIRRSREEEHLVAQLRSDTVPPKSPGCAMSPLRASDRLDLRSELRSELPSEAVHTIGEQTTNTGEVFGMLDDRRPADVQQALECMASLGRKEHWLVRDEEVTLSEGPLLGKGSFGVVMRGTYYGSSVAVKMPQEPLKRQPLATVCSLSNELRILRRGRHPNLVLFHGAVVDTKKSYIGLILELVDGVSMDEWRNHKRTPTMAAQYRVVLGICRALWFLHSQHPSIIHGDLKSSNVLVEGNHPFVNAKLLDFGLSRLLTNNSRPLGGTLAWVAPEVFKNRKAKPESCADVYSFGRLVAFAALGIRPFEGKARSEVEEAILSNRIPPPKWTSLTRLGQLCKPLIEACLLEPQERPKMFQIHSDLIHMPIFDFDDDEKTAQQLAEEAHGPLQWSQAAAWAAEIPKPATTASTVVPGNPKETGSLSATAAAPTLALNSAPVVQPHETSATGPTSSTSASPVGLPHPGSKASAAAAAAAAAQGHAPRSSTHDRSHGAAGGGVGGSGSGKATAAPTTTPAPIIWPPGKGLLAVREEQTSSLYSTSVSLDEDNDESPTMMNQLDDEDDNNYNKAAAVACSNFEDMQSPPAPRTGTPVPAIVHLGSQRVPLNCSNGQGQGHGQGHTSQSGQPQGIAWLTASTATTAAPTMTGYLSVSATTTATTADCLENDDRFLKSSL